MNLLLLQGPASPFLKEVANVAQHSGAEVHKLNFCLGDAIFWWPRPSDWFTGNDAEWPEFLRHYIQRHGITHLLMLGDGRPKHAAAIRVAEELGISAYVFEHGYLRPDWLTLEPFGMSSRSFFPTDPQTIRQLAEGIPAPDTRHLFGGSFLTYAAYDLLFHLPNVLLGWLFHPTYRSHGAVHPLAEYAGWLGKAVRRPIRKRRAQALEERYLKADHEPYFLFPLQLPGDYQIKVHSPKGDHFELVAAVIWSFSQHAPSGHRLLFKTHPIDNGLSRWPGRIGELAARSGVANRVDVIDGGNLDRLIGGACGIVTINSTVGLTALLARRPVVALGAAIYDVPGLTTHQSLADFWKEPRPPEADMPGIFARALAATTQFRGGFIGRAAMKIGAEELFRRLVEKPLWLSAESRRQRGHFRYAAELEQAQTAPEDDVPPSQPPS